MKPKFIDLFAGIGGMRIAFNNAGAECVFTCEINEAALETYKANFRAGKEHVYHKDILDLDYSSIPTHEILVAGFPCQPYSIAGLRKGLEDERGGQIFKALIKILERKKPKAFLLENVKGMLNHDNGKTLEYILESLKQCGYYTKYQSLNTKDYVNIPQNRERVFIVGFKNITDFNRFCLPEKIKLTSNIKKILLNEEEVERKVYYNKSNFKWFDKLVEQATSEDTIYQWRRHYLRENKSKLCPTLTANMGAGGHNVPIVKDRNGIRKLTPRETARFQGFPDDFVLPNNLSYNNLYHQFGNSVTVPLIQKLAEAIILAL